MTDEDVDINELKAKIASDAGEVDSPGSRSPVETDKRRKMQ